MGAYSVQRASHERETYRFSADIRQCGIHHARGQSEHRNFGGGIPQAMPFKTRGGREQARNQTEDQAMG